MHRVAEPGAAARPGCRRPDADPRPHRHRLRRRGRDGRAGHPGVAAAGARGSVREQSLCRVCAGDGKAVGGADWLSSPACVPTPAVRRRHCSSWGTEIYGRERIARPAENIPAGPCHFHAHSTGCMGASCSANRCLQSRRRAHDHSALVISPGCVLARSPADSRACSAPL